MIRLRKFNPQAPLAVIFVRETDWQKYDQMPKTNDDLYVQSWNTNFGSNPFDDGPSEYSLNTEDTEYIPLQIPEENRPHFPQDLQKIVGELSGTDHLNWMKTMKMKYHNKYPKNSKRSK